MDNQLVNPQGQAVKVSDDPSIPPEVAARISAQDARSRKMAMMFLNVMNREKFTLIDVAVVAVQLLSHVKYRLSQGEKKAAWEKLWVGIKESL